MRRRAHMEAHFNDLGFVQRLERIVLAGVLHQHDLRKLSVSVRAGEPQFCVERFVCRLE